MVQRILIAALFTFLCMVSHTGYAQAKEGSEYHEGNITLDLLEATEAYYYNTPQTNSKIASYLNRPGSGKLMGLSAVIGYAGGVMLGYAMGPVLLTKSDPRWGMMWAGTSLSLISIQLRVITEKQGSSKARDIYRGRIYASNSYSSMQIGGQTQGFGLLVSF